MFGIKLIILQSELNVTTFWICMDALFFGMSRFINHFLLIDATDSYSDQKHLFSPWVYTPFHFSQTLPLNS